MKEHILKLRNEGKTYDEIQKLVGCSLSTISFHCKNDLKNEIKLIDGISLAEANCIKKLRLENYTFQKIWIELNKSVTKEKIRMFCNKNGLSYINRVNDEQIQEIKNTYKEIGSYKKVAKELGISYETVRNYIEIEELTKEELKSHRSKSVVDWRIRTKQKLVEYKGGSCKECGYSKCVQALEFHHLDATQKDFSISGKSWSFERLKKEVDKCILLCNRCHTELHNLK